ncbi:MAG: hypothetical protein RLP14_04290 [Owenweeksia sp.]
MKTRLLLLLFLGLTFIGSAQDKRFKLVSYNSLRYTKIILIYGLACG